MKVVFRAGAQRESERDKERNGLKAEIFFLLKI